MFEVRWHGRGGQGSFLASRILGEAAVLNGNRYALAFPTFGPERRGAPVTAFTKIDTAKITDRSEVESADYIVFLDETLVNAETVKGLKHRGFIIINSSRSSSDFKEYSERIVTIDASELALKITGNPIANTALIGFLVKLSGVVTSDELFAAIVNNMKPDVAQKNIELLKAVQSEVECGSN